MSDLPTYCFDTSAWVEGWVRRYPPENFPGLWAKFSQLIEEGRIFSPEEVREELARQSDELLKWLKAQEGLFRPVTDSQQQGVIQLLEQFPRFVDSSKGRNEADPWVIVLAQETDSVVVTEEGRKPTNPKIPDICDTLQVPFLRVLEVITEESWSF